ncbi:MAG: sulfite exporter TauE/SafE family protein [Nodosilinea sp.]
MIDLLLIAGLGFFGSFGHCLGMCGPITVAFALGAQGEAPVTSWLQVRFHLLLNLGRLLSYALVGAAIGGLGSVLVAGGQMAGLGSGLRQAMTLLTGGLLIWFGLRQVSPGLLPRLPLIHPFGKKSLHERLSQTMGGVSATRRWWTPVALGLCWGLIPCGFLYVAHIKAAATAQPGAGALTMLAFGLGTLPMMAGIGLSATWLSQDRRGQLFRLGGWITLVVGVLTLTRSGDAMTDYAGYGSIGLLVTALVARPLGKLWPGPLKYRRVLGVGAFLLGLAHTVQMVQHSWQGNLRAVYFMLPHHQWGIAAGALALGLMLPLALTSSDLAQRWLGPFWRSLHLLSLPALILCTGHCVLLGLQYPKFLGFTALALSPPGVWLGVVIGVLLVRSRWFWTLLSLHDYYVSPKR